MSASSKPEPQCPATLRQAAQLGPEKVLARGRQIIDLQLDPHSPVMVLLAAGKGSRFGQQPKCAQLVDGIPLARHSINAFQHLSQSPVICLVGYCAEQVAAALGDDNLYVRSDQPAGGTAFAAYEAFSVAALERDNPVVLLTMGDRIVPLSTFRRLYHTHLADPQEADLTLLTAIYEPPRHVGKGRILRDADGRVLGIVEQKDIDAIADEKIRHTLDSLTEGNCPLYAIRARTLRKHLENVSNANAQSQFYLTDLIESVRRAGGEIRTLTTTVRDAEYDLLCSDVTRPMDLALLEGVLRGSRNAVQPGLPAVEQAAALIRADRPAGQVASIAAQIDELFELASKQGFNPKAAAALGLSGGRLRIAFMHPDMGRFYGPAWQMPTGARDAAGREQILVLLQASDDRRIHLTPANPEFQEKVGSIPSDIDCMFPGADVADWYSYEGFGTRMAENLLLSLGYFTEDEIQRRRQSQQPLPPSSLWVSTSMRRPFSLVGNAIASMRTVRTGRLGARVQAALGREHFRGLRIVSTGNIPRGGFSSSSAVTVATKNAMNALFELGIPGEMLVHLSCQAEYGTGVRAGSLDQATEQQGRAGEGTLLSSNPRENYRIMGTYPAPGSRFHVLFPYSVDRDRAAWRWSAGVYSAEPEPGSQTTGELRKITGKAAEIAAILLRLPLDQDFFKPIEPNLLAHGELSLANRRWIADVLRRIPMLITQAELREQLELHRSWSIEQLADLEKIEPALAARKTESTFTSLLAGWRDPFLNRPTASGRPRKEQGVPLRAMVGYLFAEVAKNFYLIHHPAEWIRSVSRSQWGDRSFQIDPDRLPPAADLLGRLPWEKAVSGPALLDRWLEHVGAQPFDFNRGLDDATLSANEPPYFHLIEGTNFFRGLALIDLVEAMLKRAFGQDAVAVRINAAGQGDFFQVHVDTQLASVEAAKHFLREAFYRRFDLTPEEEFVEPHPGGGALGLRLDHFDQLPDLARALREG